MPAEAVVGLADTYALFGALPGAARDQVAVELAIIGREILAAERRDVPHHTGALDAGLSVQLLLSSLRVRIGLIGIAAGRAKLFYGRIVEFGRSAQTVLVQRRRRVGGLLRTARGRKRTEDIAATYALKVKARQPVPFIRSQSDPLVEELIAARLADFWSNTLDKAASA